ncbi:MAG: RNA polymerase sigma factor [Planctomycetes bacterium]|nr:RNA polymerase sigma factor [Planctomycetota bacterium]
MDETHASTDDEGTLAERARRGDQGAKADLLAAYRQRLVRFCHGYLGRSEDAEDAAQDVLAKLLAAPWPQGKFRPWLFCVARNHCLNLERRVRGSPVDYRGAFTTSHLPSPHTGPATALGRHERDRRLAEAMQSLSRQHSEVLFLRYFEELERDEIAAVLGVTAAAVKSRLAHARRELFRRLGPQGMDEMG